MVAENVRAVYISERVTVKSNDATASPSGGRRVLRLSLQLVVKPTKKKNGRLRRQQQLGDSFASSTVYGVLKCCDRLNEPDVIDRHVHTGDISEADICCNGDPGGSGGGGAQQTSGPVHG